jgi:hypothetical protein
MLKATMSAKVTTRLLTDSEYADWNRLVASSPDGSIYSTPEYLDVLCSATGGSFHILAAERSGQVVGGIGLYERRTAWGRYVAPRLLLYYNGIVLRPHDSKYPSEQTARQNEIFDALEERLGRAGYGRVILKNRSTIRDIRLFAARGWQTWLTYTYVVPLVDIKAQWGRVEQNLRRLIQRCINEGIQVEDDEDFDSFYRMHEQTHERKRVALYLPRPLFLQYFRQLRAQNLCRLYHARLPDGRSVSSQIVLLGSHAISHSVCAGTDAEFLKSGVTAFLRWKVFEHLSDLGYAGNDLTDAALNSVTHFKSQLGGNLESCMNLRRPESAGFRVQHITTGLTISGRSFAGDLARRIGLRRPKQK